MGSPLLAEVESEIARIRTKERLELIEAHKRDKEALRVREISLSEEIQKIPDTILELLVPAMKSDSRTLDFEVSKDVSLLITSNRSIDNYFAKYLLFRENEKMENPLFPLQNELKKRGVKIISMTMVHFVDGERVTSYIIKANW